ncbi:hypothetical protein WNY37_04815 [Henriciella sp. AS95]|uniref:hypothetical protein n=1 Tax=Henriciella sp. AS95 TaxID=3135782 RepID=UPI00317330D2
MKKFAIASVAALAIAGAASAEFIDANGGDAELELVLNGTVQEICGITAASSSIDVDFGELAATDGPITRSADFGIVCNAAGGATFGMSSANGGYLLRGGTETGPGNEITYKVNFDTGGDAFPGISPGTPPLNLTVDRSFTVPGSTELLSGREVGAAIVLNGVKGPDFNDAPTTTVFAGAYSDTVTVSVTAN